MSNIKLLKNQVSRKMLGMISFKLKAFIYDKNNEKKKIQNDYMHLYM